jgi:hypothetical protein
VEDLEKLFEKFTTEDTKLKNNIINRLKTIQNKNAEPATKEEIITRCKMLPELTKKDFKVGKTYSAVIHDDIQGKIAYLTLDKKGMFKSRVKAQDKNELKKYKK